MFKIKKIRPLFTGIITTAQKYASTMTTESGILLTNKMEGQLNIFQQVIAVGTTVRDVKPGDVVCINFSRYLKAKHVPGVIQDNVQSDTLQGYYEIPQVEMDGKQFLFLQNNDIEYVVEEYEVDDGGLFQ